MFRPLLYSGVVIGMCLPAFAEPVDKNYVPEYERLTPEEAEALDRMPQVEAKFTPCTLLLPNNETMCGFLARLEREHPGNLSEHEKEMCRECADSQ